MGKCRRMGKLHKVQIQSRSNESNQRSRNIPTRVAKGFSPERRLSGEKYVESSIALLTLYDAIATFKCTLRALNEMNTTL